MALQLEFMQYFKIDARTNESAVIEFYDGKRRKKAERSITFVRVPEAPELERLPSNATNRPNKELLLV